MAGSGKDNVKRAQTLARRIGSGQKRRVARQPRDRGNALAWGAGRSDGYDARTEGRPAWRPRSFRRQAGIVSRLTWRGPDGRVHDVLVSAGWRRALDCRAELLRDMGDAAFRQSRLRQRGRRRRAPFSGPSERQGRNHPRFRLGSRPGRCSAMTARRPCSSIAGRKATDPHRYRGEAGGHPRRGRHDHPLLDRQRGGQHAALRHRYHPGFPARLIRASPFMRRARWSSAKPSARRGSRLSPMAGPTRRAPLFPSPEVTAWSFLGWDGRARVETPSIGLAITLTSEREPELPGRLGPSWGGFPLRRAAEPCHRRPERAGCASGRAIAAAGSGETLEGWLRIVPEAI